MKLTSAAISDIGCVRSRNEDSHLVDDVGGLYIVADGMGGHAAGHIASRLCVETIQRALKSADDPEITGSDLDATDANEVLVQERLRFAISRASRTIQEEAEAKPGLHGMGTTVVLLLFQDGRAFSAHVGDSRAYRWSAAGLSRITMDHTWVGEQVQAGLLTEPEGEASQFKNLLTRSVGFEPQVEADTSHREVQAGDRYLLCSDGLTNVVSEAELEHFLASNPSPQDAVRGMVDLALERGAPDNVTAVLIYADED